MNSPVPTWIPTAAGLICLAGATLLSSRESPPALVELSTWVLFVGGIALLVAGGLSHRDRAATRPDGSATPLGAEVDHEQAGGDPHQRV